MALHSKIFRGEVVHERLHPERHAFTYPHTFFCFDLAELPDLSTACPLFGYNDTRPINLRDRDYLRGAPSPLAQQIGDFLPPQATGQRTLLVTSPRYFGYAFNPVNFHLRLEGDQLLSAVAEVNNTFGDRHVYPLLELAASDTPHTWTATCPKQFHVSPFNNMQGEYHFTFCIEGERIYISIDLYRESQCIIKTWIRGNGHPLTTKDIVRYALLHPFDTALNSMPRILWQAAQLYYKKKLQIYVRPSPRDMNTLIDRDHPEAQRPVI